MKEEMFFSEQELTTARQYWSTQLSGDRDELDLQHGIKVVPEGKKENYQLNFPADLSQRILAICKDRDLLLYIILMAAFKLLLYKYTGQDEIIIASPLYSTSDEYYDYNQCIPLIIGLNGEMTFRQLLDQVKNTVIESYKNQHYSIEEVLESPGVNNPGFNYMKMVVLLENIHKKESIEDIVNQSANEMAVSFVKEGHELEVRIAYHSFLFNEDTVKDICRSYLRIFDQVLSNREIQLREIRWFPEAEREKLLFDFNDTAADYPHFNTVVDLFEHQVEKTPHQVVLAFKNHQLTYHGLNERVNRAARWLRQKGVKPGTFVGMMAIYSLEMIIGIMGILKAGGAYLPIDPGYPAKRINYMLTDAGVPVLLAFVLPGMLSGVDFNGEIANLEDPGMYHTNAANPEKINTVNDPVYVIYTSGSTGEPKGVLVEHQSLVNYTCWKINAYGFTPRDKTLQLISLCFDGFGANLYPAILSGGTLVVPDGSRYGDFKYINQVIEERQVTHMSVVPIMYRACLENIETVGSVEDDPLKSLRMVVLAGEKAGAELINLSLSRHQHITFINEYGPTEGTIAVAAYWGVTGEKTGMIGKPAANTKIYILDKHNQLQPIGVPGELCIAGNALARGYLNQPGLTAEKFRRAVISHSSLVIRELKRAVISHSSLVIGSSSKLSTNDQCPMTNDRSQKFLPNDQCPMTNDRFYLTGDRARWLADGNIELLGRIDQQVKIRGYRVEPLEIEAVLLSFESIKEAAVVVKKDAFENNSLCAYFTAGQKLKTSGLREAASAALPNYMVPSRFIQLDRMPMTPNGKLDRKALMEFSQPAGTPDAVDISDVYEELETGKPAHGIDEPLLDKFKKCLFRKNPYIFVSPLELSDTKKNLKIVKTHRHNNVILNRNMFLLLDLFDGEKNLCSLFSLLDHNNIKIKLLAYPVSAEDTLEIAYNFNDPIEVDFDGEFPALVDAVKALYRSHLIDLCGFDANDADVALPQETPVPDFDSSESLDFSFVPDEILWVDKKLSKAGVLLLGDTTGMPGSGLLYLASYLRRNGIKSYCQFYDPARDYESLRQNVQELLEKIRPEVVAFSMKWFMHIARVLEICKLVKQHSSGIKVVVGGNTAAYYPEEIIRSEYIDYLVCGDGEVPLLAICRGESPIPNCIYKQEGKIIKNPITYKEDETNCSDIYLSHLDEILLSRHAPLLGSFFIYTHKGCNMNCLYCGNTKSAHEQIFNRKTFFIRNVPQVRHDILAAKKFTSTFFFDFDAPNEDLLEYCKQIWEGIDLSSHFGILNNLIPPSAQLVALGSQRFKYVYWDFDVASLSERHRQELYAAGKVKPQPTDSEIFAFLDECEKYPNTEVRISLIAGLPLFTTEDIEESERVIRYLLNTYTCLSEFHWARLHAQPGAPIVKEAGIYDMHSYAVNYSDFLVYSEKNFRKDSPYPGLEYFEYPYIYYNDQRLNSKISLHYLEMNRLLRQHKETKSETFVEAVSEIEKQLARIWKDILGVEKVGVNDNFFELGGNSFSLMRVHPQVEELYPGCLTITDFFAYTTIAKLAEVIEKKQGRQGKQDKKTKITPIHLPGEYFHDQAVGQSSFDLGFEISGEVLDNLKIISRRERVEIADILLAAYMYLFARVNGESRVVCQTMYRDKGLILPAEADLAGIEDFTVFFRLLTRLREKNGPGGYGLEDIGKINLKKEINQVVPFFYHRDMLPLGYNLPDVYDIVMGVEEQDNCLSFTCEFNGRLKEEKVEELINLYVELNDLVISQCLERGE